MTPFTVGFNLDARISSSVGSKMALSGHAETI